MQPINILPNASISIFSGLKNREYIEKTKLRKIRYKILEFNPMVLKGKVNPDSSRPELLHPVSSVYFFIYS